MLAWSLMVTGVGKERHGRPRIGRRALMIVESVSSPCRTGPKVHGNPTLSAIMSEGGIAGCQPAARGRHSVLVAKRMTPPAAGWQAMPGGAGRDPFSLLQLA